MTIHVHRMPGKLPNCWERSAVFYANLLSIFYGNDTETDVLRKEVGALETYGSRLIPIIDLIFQKRSNLLVLEKSPDEALLNYFKNDLGLSLPALEILSHEAYLEFASSDGAKTKPAKSFFETLKKHPAEWLDGYVTDTALENLSSLSGKKTICSQEGSRRGNNKLLLHQFLEKTNLPLFDTHIAKEPHEITRALLALKEKGYAQAVVKAAVGASGIGMIKVNLSEIKDASGPFQLPDYFYFESACLVQGWLDSSFPDVHYIGSPSVQMFIGEESCELYDITEQILSDASVHEGNVAPPAYLMEAAMPAELLAQAEIAARWLHEQGYRGTASTDFHLVTRGDDLEIRICEINARVTGATYPALLARHFLPGGAWLLRNVRFDPAIASKAILETLDKEKLLYKPGQDKGILPFNFNPDEAGAIVKGQFLFIARNVKDAYHLLQDLATVHSLKGDYDRD